MIVLFLAVARLRNHNTTDDGNVDFRYFKTILRSKLGKIIRFIGSKAVK